MSQEINPSVFRQIENKIDSMCAANKIVGASIGITSDNDLIWTYNFGYSDFNSQTRPDENTIYRIASITKTFTSTSIFQLRDKNKLDLDDPITKYIPEFKKADASPTSIEEVTIRRLLCHHSGIIAEAPSNEPYWTIKKIPDVDNILANIPSIKIVAEQDTIFKYSNLGFVLLGEVISRISGIKYQDYVTNSILIPLGMRSTVFNLDNSLKNRFATGYQSSKDSSIINPVEDEDLRGYVAAGQLYSTIKDLSKWTSLQFDSDQNNQSSKQIIGYRSLREMQRPTIMDNQWTTGYCLPWIARKISDEIVLRHTGFTYGFRADLSFVPKQRLGVIVLSNTVPELPPLTNLILEHILNSRVPLKDNENITDTTVLQKELLGLYSGELGLTLKVEYINSSLQVNLVDDTALGFAPGPLTKTSKADIFVANQGRWFGEQIKFLRDKDGFVYALDLGPFRFTMDKK